LNGERIYYVNHDKSAEPTTRRGPAAEPSRVAKALGHPARVATKNGSRVVSACVRADRRRMPLARRRVAHLKVLKEAGSSGRIDARARYCVNPAPCARLKDFIGGL
jgi:ribosomal protein L34